MPLVASKSVAGLRCLAVALALAVGLSAAGCGDDTPFSSLTGGSKSKTIKKPKGKSAGGLDAGEDDADDGDGDGIGEDGENGGRVTKNIDNSGANFQAKDVALLRSSVDSCMGIGMTAIQDSMMMVDLSSGGDPAVNETVDAEGRVRFLLPNTYKVGDDVVEKEKGNLVDLSGGARTGIAADSLTDTYLRSLETIGNVVAHNCDATKPECACGSKADAMNLLKRCLPGLDPDTVEMDQAATSMAGVCAQGPAGMRTAIASFIASYAFASAR